MDLQRLQKILEQIGPRRAEKAVVHSVDIDRVSIVIGNSPNVIRNVEVIGEPPEPGTEVNVIWIEKRPIVSTNDLTGSISTASTSERGLLPRLSGIGNQFLNALGDWVQVTWDNIAGKPSLFPPAPHTHTGVGDSNQIILYSNGEASSYVSNAIGLADALLAAVAGDTIFIPAVEITIAGFTLTDGVAITGIETQSSILNTQIVLGVGCELMHLTVVSQLESESDSIAVEGPASGEAKLFDCVLKAFNCSSGDAVGLEVNAGDVIARECVINGESVSGSGYGVRQS